MNIIDVTNNVKISLALPLRRVGVYTGSALYVGIRGIPESFGGHPVGPITVTLTNADGTPVTAQCVKAGYIHVALFAASNFTAWGFISRGVKIVGVVQDGDASHNVTFGVGDLEIAPDSAEVRRGDPDRTVQGKGDDVYLKSEIVNGVQHYKRMAIVNNPRVGWAYGLVGDYILVDGEVREAN